MPETPRKFRRTLWLEETTGIDRRTWERYRMTGGGPPFYRIGGVVLYDEHEALEWIASRRATSTTEEQQRKVS
jgi:hypothetical protein